MNETSRDVAEQLGLSTDVVDMSMSSEIKLLPVAVVGKSRSPRVMNWQPSRGENHIELGAP
jgi:hypothetical protein